MLDFPYMEIYSGASRTVSLSDGSSAAFIPSRQVETKATGFNEEKRDGPVLRISKSSRSFSINAGAPASANPIPSSSRISSIFSLSFTVYETAALCAPSLSVVSRIFTAVFKKHHCLSVS